MLYDNGGRKIDYLRLAVTDRCNLRCFYCMPHEGIDFVPRSDLLTYEELLRLCSVFSELGIRKIRITGGEPFVRKGIDSFLRELSKTPGLEELNITTNGSFTANKIKLMEEIGVKSVNLSLDTLNRERFKEITRRDLFDQVHKTYELLLKSSMNLKINMVVMQDRNIEDIYPMIELTKENKVSVRFIEEMPFNGTADQGNESFWPMKKILDHIQSEYAIKKLTDPTSSTSYNYQVDGYRGSFGIIAAFTRSFCGSCNRIRLTPKGDLRTCLYGKGALNFRDLLRAGASNEDIKKTVIQALGKRAKDGFEAEKNRGILNPASESMATIGG